MAVLILLAAIGSLRDEGTAQQEGLEIVFPRDGAIVHAARVQVRGTAPAGAEIVLDLTFRRDSHTDADIDGQWTMQVELDEGENELVFRIGSDQDTEKRVRVTYVPSEPASSSAPTLPTAPTPTPAPAVAGFDDGDHIVGSDIQPGTYRLRSTPPFLCYWERLSGFGGSFEEIIANGTGSGYLTVSIASSDAGFSSQGCGHWSADLSAVTNPAGPISEDGVYIVGVDVAPGAWRSEGGSDFGCYIARLSGFGGTFDEIIANDASTSGSLIVTIAASDGGFETTGCGTWTKTG